MSDLEVTKFVGNCKEVLLLRFCLKSKFNYSNCQEILLHNSGL